MSRADDELQLLLVDGDNLMHRLRGARDDAGLAWLIPRLRASLAPGGTAILVLDGHPFPGEPPRKAVAPGVELRHSGRVDADTAIVEILEARPFVDRARTAVITDDRGLTERAKRVGGMTRRLDWLRDRLERPPAGPRTGLPSAAAPGGTAPGRRGSSLGSGRPPRTGAPPPADDETRRWRPGRGATAKRGNPRRGSGPADG
ncbi:MAG: hypothetical protein H0W00_01885 [Chloroflexi bacterium]|nr:hypothetical protein [Chloroflexota bacterium]